MYMYNSIFFINTHFSVSLLIIALITKLNSGWRLGVAILNFTVYTLKCLILVSNTEKLGIGNEIHYNILCSLTFLRGKIIFPVLPSSAQKQFITDNIFMVYLPAMPCIHYELKISRENFFAAVL